MRWPFQRAVQLSLTSEVQQWKPYGLFLWCCFCSVAGAGDTLVGAARLRSGPHSAHIQVARSTSERSTGSAIESLCSFPSELKICSAPCHICLGCTGQGDPQEATDNRESASPLEKCRLHDSPRQTNNNF